MPRRPVSERLRFHLARLYRQDGRGVQTQIAAYSQQRPGGAKLTSQDLSYFMNRTPGRRAITLDDLDDIAAYFRMSIGELLDDTKLGDLSGDEQRLVENFRGLPESVRDALLVVLDHAAMSTSTALQRYGRSKESGFAAHDRPPRRG